MKYLFKIIIKIIYKFVARKVSVVKNDGFEKRLMITCCFGAGEGNLEKVVTKLFH
jgi:hypothetical protein